MEFNSVEEKQEHDRLAIEWVKYADKEGLNGRKPLNFDEWSENQKTDHVE